VQGRDVVGVAPGRDDFAGRRGLKRRDPMEHRKGLPGRIESYDVAQRSESMATAWVMATSPGEMVGRIEPLTDGLEMDPAGEQQDADCQRRDTAGTIRAVSRRPASEVHLPGRVASAISVMVRSPQSSRHVARASRALERTVVAIAARTVDLPSTVRGQAQDTAGEQPSDSCIRKY